MTVTMTCDHEHEYGHEKNNSAIMNNQWEYSENLSNCSVPVKCQKQFLILIIIVIIIIIDSSWQRCMSLFMELSRLVSKFLTMISLTNLNI